MPPLDVHVLHHHPDVIPQLEALAVAAAQEALAGLVIFIIIVRQVHQPHQAVRKNLLQGHKKAEGRHAGDEPIKLLPHPVGQAAHLHPGQHLPLRPDGPALPLRKIAGRLIQRLRVYHSTARP